MNHPTPPALLKAIGLTALIGAGCLGLGILYFLKTKDRVLLFLSLLVFLGCTAKALSLYRIVRKRRYEVVEGTCIRAAQKPFGKMQTVGLLDADGTEHIVYLPKSCKMRVGRQYRLYFSQRRPPCSGNRRLDAALQTEGFLGYEGIADETPSSSS